MQDSTLLFARSRRLTSQQLLVLLGKTWPRIQRMRPYDKLDESNYINEEAQDITIIHENDNNRFQLQHEEKRTGKSDKGLRCQGSVDVVLVLHL